jgi:hypothetical protein
VDFSWVKQLADQSNEKEQSRLEKDQRQREDQKTAAMATCPFVEKLHVVLSGATEEFNNLCHYPKLRINMSRLYRHSKSAPEPGGEPDEVSYFSFQRLDYMYGVKGVNGLVEFIRVPVSDTLTVSIKLHELQVPAIHTLQAELDPESNKVRWMHDNQPVDGPAIISLCRKFFVDLIERTNAEL